MVYLPARQMGGESVTKEGFRSYLQPLIDQGMAFHAYWHPHGFGVVKTGPIPTQKIRYILHRPGKADKTYSAYGKCYNAKERTRGAWMETTTVEGKPRQISTEVLNRWNKNIDRLRRGCAGEVITVVFDGHNLSTEGGIEPWN